MPITFEITRSQRLLRQYYELRHTYFKRDLGIEDFDGFEDEGDRNGKILIAHRAGEVIAGARISTSEGMLRQVREFDLAPDRCCMWERLVISPEERNLEVGRDFTSAMIDVSLNLGYRHAMVLSTLRISRLYRLCHAGLGIEFEIKRAAPECVSPAFAELDHYISLAHIHQRDPVRPVMGRANTGAWPAMVATA